MDGNMDIQLRRQLRHYSKVDPPPKRILPIPLEIIRHTVELVYSDPNSSVSRRAIADLISAAFFFLMRPGEYCQIDDIDGYHPFRLCDLTFHQGDQILNSLLATKEELLQATHVTVRFNLQKNARWGEEISQAASGHPVFCPCRALARRLLHLRANSAPMDTGVDVFYMAFCAYKKHVTAKAINMLLRQSCTLLPHFGHPPKATTTRALRSSGAMALMAAQVDSDHIKLLGRWQSDAMLTYLHVASHPVRNQFARAMVEHGSFTTPLQPAPPEPLRPG